MAMLWEYQYGIHSKYSKTESLVLKELCSIFMQIHFAKNRSTCIAYPAKIRYFYQGFAVIRILPAPMPAGGGICM